MTSHPEHKAHDKRQNSSKETEKLRDWQKWNNTRDHTETNHSPKWTNKTTRGSTNQVDVFVIYLDIKGDFHVMVWHQRHHVISAAAQPTQRPCVAPPVLVHSATCTPTSHHMTDTEEQCSCCRYQSQVHTHSLTICPWRRMSPTSADLPTQKFGE